MASGTSGAGQRYLPGAPLRRAHPPRRPGRSSSVGELALVLDLLAFNANVGHPVLAAAVGQPVTFSLSCWSKAGRRSSSSSTIQRAKPLVSVMASLQNSVPVQATVPRQKDEPSTCKPILPSSPTSAAVLALGRR